MAARIAAACLLLATAACDNRDEELERELREICDTLELGTTTLRDQALRWGEFPVFISCQPTAPATPNGLEPIPGQICAGASVCQWRYQGLSNDCGPGGCTFVCDVRTEDVASGGIPSLDTPICARRFLTRQPFVFN